MGRSKIYSWTEETNSTNYVQNVPTEFDLYLGGIVYGNFGDNNTVNDFSGAMLYIVHKRFYDTFLSLPEDEHLDRSLRNKGLFVVCDPMVVTQHNGYSDNNKIEMDYGRFFQNRRLFQ